MYLQLTELIKIPSYLRLLEGLNAAMVSGGPFEGNVLYKHAELDLNKADLHEDHVGLRRGFSHAVMGRSRMLEIGFNAGHSALTYLFLNPHGIYTGVDIFQRQYTHEAFNFLSNKFPYRVNLHKGDSLQVVPRLLASTDIEYDVVHVDGGHTFECAMGDLINVRPSLSHNALVILDDSVAPEVGRALADVIEKNYYKYHPMNELYKSSYQAYLTSI
jgi:predicted O-methyltransferase YrrM